MVMLFPATRAILGRGTGTVSIIIPLTVSAFPYVARMVEGSLLEVDNGVVEAAQAMGSTTFQIVRKELIPEAMPSLVNGFAICITTILGYTAMAGTAGGDGLGKVAITYGLNKRQYDVMYAASIVLVLLVAALARYATRPIGAHARRVWIPKMLPASLDTLYGNRLQCQLSIRAIDASALTQTCVFTKRRFLWQCYLLSIPSALPVKRLRHGWMSTGLSISIAIS